LRAELEGKYVPAALPCIVAIGTATPGHDIHAAFIDWAAKRFSDRRNALIFKRMVGRAGIAHRWSVIPPLPDGGSPVAPGGFYACDPLPQTSARMALYAGAAPDLAMAAIGALGDQVSLDGITHIIVASCTGFTAPGIDQIIAARMGLDPSVERLMIGFMGCYAAVTALKAARHIVRSEPEARVLVVTVELSTLHLQPDTALEPLLAMLQFGDGAAAALVTAEGPGLALDDGFAMTLPDSTDLIRWVIGDHGFAMTLSGEVPGRIADALRRADARTRFARADGAPVTDWAVHAGGRSILDAVSAGLELQDTALDASRAVLNDAGNMSSATLMFVLARLMQEGVGHGVALAFGPGLAAEGFHFSGMH
jgi:alpha-pyrone synthase